MPECVPPLCLPSQKLSWHLVCTRKSSPSILCFCATTLCKLRELSVPGNFLLRRFERTAKKTSMVSRHGFSIRHCDFYSSWNGNLLPLRTGSTILKTNGPLIYQKAFDLVPIVSDIERTSMRYLWRAASLHRHGESLAATALDLTFIITCADTSAVSEKRGFGLREPPCFSWRLVA